MCVCMCMCVCIRVFVVCITGTKSRCGALLRIGACRVLELALLRLGVRHKVRRDVPVNSCVAMYIYIYIVCVCVCIHNYFLSDGPVQSGNIFFFAYIYFAYMYYNALVTDKHNMSATHKHKISVFAYTND